MQILRPEVVAAAEMPLGGDAEARDGSAGQRPRREIASRKEIRPTVQGHLTRTSIGVQLQGMHIHPTAAPTDELNPVRTPVGLNAVAGPDQGIEDKTLLFAIDVDVDVPMDTRLPADERIHAPTALQPHPAPRPRQDLQDVEHLCEAHALTVLRRRRHRVSVACDPCRQADGDLTAPARLATTGPALGLTGLLHTVAGWSRIVAELEGTDGVGGHGRGCPAIDRPDQVRGDLELPGGGGQAVLLPQDVGQLPGQRVLREGERLVQSDLARSFEQLGSDGARQGFYEGSTAERICAALEPQGSPLAPDDFAGFQAAWVAPISSTYRGYDVYEMPPSTQGFAALQVFNLLGGYDVSAWGRAPPTTTITWPRW